MYATSSQYGQRCVLITGGYDQKIRLWNTETGAEIRTLQHEKSVSMPRALFGLVVNLNPSELLSASELHGVEPGEDSARCRR